MTRIDPPVLPSLRAWRLAAGRALLGLAYADSDPGDGPPPVLPDPGGWPGLFAVLLEGPEACELRALGLEPRLLATLELARIEGAGVGPAGGILRGTPCAARERLGTVVGPIQPPWLEAAGKLTGLPPSVTLALAELGARGQLLTRLAAADSSESARWITQPALSVHGAPGWLVTLTLNARLGGGWMATARRSWAGSGIAPEPPALELIWNPGPHETRHALAPQGDAVAWVIAELPLKPRARVTTPETP